MALDCRLEELCFRLQGAEDRVGRGGRLHLGRLLGNSVVDVRASALDQTETTLLAPLGAEMCLIESFESIDVRSARRIAVIGDKRRTRKDTNFDYLIALDFDFSISELAHEA